MMKLFSHFRVVALGTALLGYLTSAGPLGAATDRTISTSATLSTEARTLVWDRARGRFAATAPYKFRVYSEKIDEAAKKPIKFKK